MVLGSIYTCKFVMSDTSTEGKIYSENCLNVSEVLTLNKRKIWNKRLK